MTPVEFLAEKYNYITFLRNRDEISEATADEWRAKFLMEAKKMEEQQLVCPHCKDLEVYIDEYGGKPCICTKQTN